MNLYLYSAEKKSLNSCLAKGMTDFVFHMLFKRLIKSEH